MKATTTRIVLPVPSRLSPAVYASDLEVETIAKLYVGAYAVRVSQYVDDTDTVVGLRLSVFGPDDEAYGEVYPAEDYRSVMGAFVDICETLTGAVR